MAKKAKIKQVVQTTIDGVGKLNQLRVTGRGTEMARKKNSRVNDPLSDETEAGPRRGRAARQRRPRGEQGSDQGPDMSGVVKLSGGDPTVKETLTSLSDLKPENFAGGSDGPSEAEAGAEATPATEPVEEAAPAVEPVEEAAPAVEPVEEAASAEEEHDMGAGKDILAEMGSLAGDASRQLAEAVEMKDSAPAIMKMLEETVYPGLEEAKKAGNSEATARFVDAIRAAKRNPAVLRLIKNHEQADLEEQERATRQQRFNNMSSLYDELPEDPTAETYPDGRVKRLNSIIAAIEATKEVDDKTSLLVVRLLKGSRVPAAPDHEGRWSVTNTIELLEDAAVLVEIKATKVEQKGDWTEVYREYKVLKGVGGLNFHRYKQWRGGELGVFNFFPRFYRTRDESKRDEDPGDAIKESMAYMHNREWKAQEQSRRLAEATKRAKLSVTKLLLEGMVGSAAAEYSWGDGRDADEKPLEEKHAAIVVSREEDGGPIHVISWGRANTTGKDKRHAPFFSQLMSTQDEGGDRQRLDLEYEVSGDPQDGKCAVFVNVASHHIPSDVADAKRWQWYSRKDLGVLLSRALIAEAENGQGMAPPEAIAETAEEATEAVAETEVTAAVEEAPEAVDAEATKATKKVSAEAETGPATKKPDPKKRTRKATGAAKAS